MTPGGRRTPPPSRKATATTPIWKTTPALIVGAVVLLVATWALWPTQWSNVKNRDSRGSTVIAFGDSLTAGYGASPGDEYPSRLAEMLGRDVINAGVSGDTTDGALSRLGRDVLTRDPRIVIVGLGGNDFLRGIPIAATEQNLREIIRRLQGAGAMVVLLGFRFPSLTSSYEAMYARVAEEEGCLFIPDLLDGILSDPGLRSDAIHPNARGYRLMAERVSGPVGKLIRKTE